MTFKKPLAILLISLFMVAFKSDKPAYMLFDKEGKNMKYGKMLEEIASADVV